MPGKEPQADTMRQRHAAGSKQGKEQAKNDKQTKETKPIPTREELLNEINGDSCAMIPLSMIALATLLTFFCCWPARELWTPPINHAGEFRNWHFGVPANAFAQHRSLHPSSSTLSSSTLSSSALHPTAQYASHIRSALQKDRIVSVQGESGGASAAISAYVDWAAQADNADGGKGLYDVVLWIKASSVDTITMQYMELGHALGLRVEHETGPAFVARALAWLYRQPSYLIIFEGCDGHWGNTKHLEAFIPKGFGLGKQPKEQTIRTGHVLLAGPKVLHPSNLVRVKPVFKSDDSRLAFASTLLPPAVAHVDLPASTRKLLVGLVDSLDDSSLVKAGLSHASTAAEVTSALTLAVAGGSKSHLSEWVLASLQTADGDNTHDQTLQLLRMLALAPQPMPLELLTAWAQNLQPGLAKTLTQKLGFLASSGVVSTFEQHSSYGESLSAVRLVAPLQQADFGSSSAQAHSTQARLALALELVQAAGLAEGWPTSPPLRTPDFLFKDDLPLPTDNVTKGLLMHERRWGRQYYDAEHFKHYHSHEAVAELGRSSRRHMLLRANRFLGALTAAAELIGSTLGTTGEKTAESTALLQQVMTQSFVRVRFVLHVLSQAGHYTLTIHDNAKAAGKIFRARLILAKLLAEIFSETPRGQQLTGDELALAYRDRGAAAVQDKKYQLAEKSFKSALSLLTAAHGENHAVVLMLHAEMGVAGYARAMHEGKGSEGRPAFDLAKKYLQHAIDASKSAGAQSLSVAYFHHRLARLESLRGEHQQAIMADQRALQIEMSALGDYHLSVATRLDYIGQAWSTLNRPKDALHAFQRALQVSKEVLDSLHPGIGARTARLGTSLSQAHGGRKARQALRHLVQALSIEEEAAGEHHPQVLARLQALGDLHKSVGTLDKALVNYHRIYKIEVAFRGKEDPVSKEWEQTCLQLYFYIKQKNAESAKANRDRQEAEAANRDKQ